VEGASSLFVAEMGDHCTHYPEHNLVRCPTQLALVKSIETQETALRKFAWSFVLIIVFGRFECSGQDWSVAPRVFVSGASGQNGPV
jgi:hypothetical protein